MCVIGAVAKGDLHLLCVTSAGTVNGRTEETSAAVN